MGQVEFVGCNRLTTVENFHYFQPFNIADIIEVHETAPQNSY